MLQDLRYALRLARRQPAFTALVIATLTLGIGASTTVFTICDRVLLRPLPFPQPGRLVWIDRLGFGVTPNGRLGISRLVATSTAFNGIGMFVGGGLNLGDGPEPARLHATAASPGFFTALGVKPMAGRLFNTDDESQIAKVALVSYDMWKIRLEGRRDLVGQTVRLNGRDFDVAGVMPRGFSFPGDTDVWVLPGADSQLAGSAFAPSVVARLAPGVNQAMAMEQLDRINEARKARNPGFDPERAVITPLQEKLTGKARPTLLLLTAVVTLLLLTTAANVAGLLLSRMRGRERELVVRAAIGATRGRIVTQVIVESLTLSTMAGVAGLLLSTWAVRAFSAAAPAFAPDADLTSVDARFVGISMLIMAATALLFAAVPAFAASRAPAGNVLRASRTATDRTQWFKSGLVVAQVGTALVLLTVSGAALVVVMKYMRVDVGFHNDNAVMFELMLPLSRYSTNAAVVQVVDDLTARLAATAGVRRVGTSNFAPGSSAMGVGAILKAAGAPEGPGGVTSSATLLVATPDYFAALGIRLLAGRAFTKDDRPGAPPVAVISESSARRLWKEPAAAIGRHLSTRLPGVDKFEPEIVGVVADVRLRGVTDEARPQLYLPLPQRPPFGGASFVVDAAVSPDQLLPAIREAVRSVDPDLPPYNVVLIRQLRARFLATERLTLSLTTAFSVIALALSAIGLYGVLSQFVAQRTREIGIRMALGANRSRVRRGIVFAGLRVAVAGIVIGVIAAGAASRAIAAFVPGLEAPSTMTIAAQSAVMLLVAMLASWIPARRASSVDPVVALRAD